MIDSYYLTSGRLVIQFSFFSSNNKTINIFKILKILKFCKTQQCLITSNLMLPEIQTNGLIGLKKLFRKITLSITNLNILTIFKKLVSEALEKFIVQIGKILMSILH